MRVVGIATSVSLLGGCLVVGPDYKAPQLNLPSKWGSNPRKAEVRAPELSRWWERLNDPLLNKLMAEAVAGNLDVATAKAKIREARATHKQAFGSLFPSVEGTASANRGRADEVVANDFKAGFDSSWELDLFGANKRSAEAARFGIDAAEWELRSTLLTLVGDVATYYTEARGYQARIALAKQTASSQANTAKLTRTKFDAGTASAVDVANAEGQAASTAADIPTLESAYTEDVHRLAVLTGREPSALTDQMAKGGPIPVPRLPIPTGVPADVLLSRPDVRAAERQYAQYTAKVGQAQAALYPSVSLSGNIDTEGVKIGDLAKGSAISWSFGPSLTVPIFQGGQLRAAVEVAQAQRDQYFIAYKSAVLTALEDVENAIVSLNNQRIAYRRRSVSAKAYIEASRLSNALYQSGASSFLDVLTAARSAYSAEDAQIQGRVAITTDYVALNKALGGGWDGQVDSSKPEIVDTHTGPHLAKIQE
ncbi:efflux transporter, outer membrane factor (OMF) lipoprotein, NodT family [Kaistia soli DSM 19436]|uniref:Efflux transporter, outer membrane factor (OMF) lipoprotein, NodT family n=1 Tax=Kaistia soli DSM 19436 TaxID=1122133 RepID=A0A1M5KJC6_9HYPH|nr:efflux transporter outer membrane subunit [Kaistia soli]SHG52273.1 efflux transporter, outer membrane factor (OMF) lipoprotein, NodT family [Kaistia soli DSM 19436]